MKKALALLTLIALVLPILSGCVTEKPKTQFSTKLFNYFHTVSTIVGCEESMGDFSAEINHIASLLDEYHKLFDIYNDYYECSNCNTQVSFKSYIKLDERTCTKCKKTLSDSEIIITNISLINRVVDGEHQVVKVDRKIIDMLLMAKEMYNLTGGKMNIAMGSVLSIWHDYREAGLKVPRDAWYPSMDELMSAAEHTDINDIIIDEENSTVHLRDPEMKLDVGAFAKGYAVEMIARDLEARGKTNYVLNIGGNIRTVGTKLDGSDWKTGIENPADDESYIEFIGLGGRDAIVTSGSYQRYYSVVTEAKCSTCDWVYNMKAGIPEKDVVPGTIPSHLPSGFKCPECDSRVRKTTESFHHIIDRDTLMPAEGLLSVSIICSDSGMGDGLSTALFCMSIEDGMALIESLDGVEALWVDENETKHYSSGFNKYIYEK